VTVVRGQLSFVWQGLTSDGEAHGSDLTHGEDGRTRMVEPRDVFGQRTADHALLLTRLAHPVHLHARMTYMWVPLPEGPSPERSFFGPCGTRTYREGRQPPPQVFQHVFSVLSVCIFVCFSVCYPISHKLDPISKFPFVGI
jgi:hypothetical protein